MVAAVSSMESSDAYTLLKALLAMWQSRSKNGEYILPLLINHSDYVISQEFTSQLLDSLYKLTKSKGEITQSLLQLSGRLQLFTAQVNVSINMKLRKNSIMLEVSSGERTSSGIANSSKRRRHSGLESELDNLRKELSSTDGGIFPHSVLSTQQITMLCSQKPETTQQLEKIIGKLKTQKYGDKILEVIGKH
ncbi:hypothetical protein LXL04_020414 [Taraxacum kok-saghyz]